MHWGGLCSEPGKGPGSISPGRVWLSLLPDPAGSFEEVVNAKEDKKHMGKMEVRRPYSKQKREHINRGEWSSSAPQGCVWTLYFPTYGAQYSGIMQQPHTFPLLLHVLLLSPD